jgi:hypothetical protein
LSVAGVFLNASTFEDDVDPLSHEGEALMKEKGHLSRVTGTVHEDAPIDSIQRPTIRHVRTGTTTKRRT